MNQRRIVIIFIALFFCLPLLANARVSLSPAAIDGGGVSLVRWSGPPPATVTVHFNGRQIAASSAGGEVLALVGADLETAPGSYLVSVAGRDREGRDFLYALPLEVRAAQWPEERLTLPPAMVSPKDPQVLERIAREQKRVRQLFAKEDHPPLWDGFVLPVADPLGSPFGLRRILNGEPRAPHAGVDFRSPRGTHVRAAGRGRPVLTDDLYYTGKTVILDHGAGLFSVYAHLEEILCGPDDLLERGAILGRVGSTGRSTGPHLHWGIKLRGDRIDPLQLIRTLAAQDP